MTTTKYVKTFFATTIRQPVAIMERGLFRSVECAGCGETFTAKRDNLPSDMIGYCANTGKREHMTTR